MLLLVMVSLHAHAGFQVDGYHGYTSIPQYVMIHFHMQRFKFIDFMVIELCFFKKEKKMMENMDKCGNHFSDIMQISQHNTTNFVYRLFLTHSSPVP